MTSQLLVCKTLPSTTNQNALIANLCMAKALLDCDSQGIVKGTGKDLIEGLFDANGAWDASGMCWNDIIIAYYDDCSCSLTDVALVAFPVYAGCFQSTLTGIATNTFGFLAVFQSFANYLEDLNAKTIDVVIEYITALEEVIRQYNALVKKIQKVPELCPV